MRSIEQIKTDITEVERRLVNVKDFDAIAICPEGELLLSMFERSHKFYQDTINGLDENNPALAKEFAKNRICMKLVDKFAEDFTNSTQVMEDLKKELLSLNVELGKANDEKARREREAM
jgi:hypothetical protein